MESKMKNYYKATFYLNSPIVMSKHERTTFDSLIAYAYAQEQKKGYEKQVERMNYEEKDLIDFSPMPIVMHQNGYFMASWMMWSGEIVEFTESWKKRWANEHDHLAGFGKRKRKVRINNADYKSYNVPLGVIDIPEVYFYFQSDDPAEVERLLSTHIASLGKKRSQGFGEIEDVKIEKIDFNPFEKTIRPIPIAIEDLKLPKNSGRTARMMAWKPPYFLPINQSLCFID